MSLTNHDLGLNLNLKHDSDGEALALRLANRVVPLPVVTGSGYIQII